MNSNIYKKFSAIATTQAKPIQASLELTFRCNERCTHCYIEEFKDDPRRILSIEQWYHILEELRRAGTLYLILMGGEPLLSPHLLDISQKASEMGFHVSIISNGLKIRNLEYAQKLRQHGLRLATFSLYSLDPAIHDKITQVKGSHQRLLNAIEYCDQAGIEVALNSLLTQASAKGVFELYDWASSRGYELKVDPNITPKLNGNLDPTIYRANRETLLWFYREKSKRWPRSTPQANKESQDDYICNAAKGKCAITPYGELLPCIEIRESFGSLIDQPFEEIWFSERAKKWRQPKLKDMKNGSSHGLYAFCDHCPGMAKNENGQPFELTSYTQLVGKVKRQVNREFADSFERARVEI